MSLAIIVAFKILIILSIAAVILSIVAVSSGIIIIKKKKVDKPAENDKLPKEPRKLTTLMDIQLDAQDLVKFNNETNKLVEKWKNKK
jgi:hypothetical protein